MVAAIELHRTEKRPERIPHVDVLRPEGGRNHSDDRRRRRAKRDAATDGRWRAGKATLPQRVRDQRDRRCARLLLVVGEQSARRRCHPEQREDAALGGPRRDCFRSTVDEDGDAAVGVVDRHVLKRARTRAPIEEVGIGDVQLESGTALVQPRDPAGLAIWKRLQQDRIDHAEDRGVGADPERQRQCRDQREPRRARDHPEGVSEVVEHP